jgi:hypothetical protein
MILYGLEDKDPGKGEWQWDGIDLVCQGDVVLVYTEES